MYILFVFFISFILLLAGVYKGIFIAYPLFLVFILFILLAYKEGIKTKTIIEFLKKGIKVSFVVFQVLVLIGALTGSWMSSGTVGALVYYGVTYLNPTFFALYAFLICSFISFLLGSSFGTIGTIGIALIVIARSGGGNIPLIAGAIISGAYVGDRNSLDPQNPLATIISGGGMISMVKIITVIIISSSIASIIEVIKVTEIINKFTHKAKGDRAVFLYTTIISFFSAAFGCTQVIAVMLTHLLGKDMYRKNEISNEIFALNIENTAIVIAPLIPWNIAVLAPLLLLEAPTISIIYALYLYILPAYRLLVPYNRKVLP